MSPELPVLELLPRLRETLAERRLALLQAPPGAGKSTGLPPQLLDEPWLEGRGVVLLQPRRVAARGVAARIAAGLGEEVGGTVGYRVRFESRVSARTRLTVMTEGILTRMVQADPELPGVGLILFDEFHERSLSADLALALVREVQAELRPDLRVLLMSATLDPALPARLGDVPLLTSQGRSYPVELRYLPTDPVGPVEGAVVSAVRGLLAQSGGDILAFLPGVPEIRRALSALEGSVGLGVSLLQLSGDLPLAVQGQALLPDPQGLRRVVLATSIAETSLTIDGVTAVVDGGFSRRSLYDPGSGLTRLATVRVTRDAADQRAGRAGRTAPGLALRLWSERTQAALAESRPPEMLEADLSGLVLELAGWGTPDPSGLRWLDPPPPARVESARELLRELGALTAEGAATPQGLRLLELPTHPRLAHLLLEGRRRGLGALAADLAALLEERDPLRGSGADLGERLTALRRFRAGHKEGRGEGAGDRDIPGRMAGDRDILARVERLARSWRGGERSRENPGAPDLSRLGELVALAYPERVAALRPGERERYLLAGGQGMRLPPADPLVGEPLLAVAHLDPRLVDGEGRILLAAPLSLAAVVERVSASDVVRWDTRSGTVLARRERRLGEIVLDSQMLNPVPAPLRMEALQDGVRQEGLEVLGWTPAARQWRARVGSLRAWRPEEGWPDLSDAALLDRLPEWLPGLLDGARSRAELGRLDPLPGLTGLLPWPLAGRLDELAPATLPVPSGHRVRLEYREGGEPPVLAVKLQELFGLADTPTVNGGRTAALLHLLSPARRPVQVTQDLRSFWERGYFEARRDLRGQYPRHPWPDDPWTAEATRRVKPRGT